MDIPRGQLLGPPVLCPLSWRLQLVERLWFLGGGGCYFWAGGEGTQGAPPPGQEVGWPQLRAPVGPPVPVATAQEVFPTPAPVVSQIWGPEGRQPVVGGGQGPHRDCASGSSRSPQLRRVGVSACFGRCAYKHGLFKPHPWERGSNDDSEFYRWGY